jgi:predicted nucleic acid-binding protein
MIIVDTNVIAYLYMPTEYSSATELLLEKHPIWAAPPLWRSELRNVLALYIRQELLTFDRAFGIQLEAEELMADHQYDVNSYDVLKLSSTSGCSAYDCEFVSLAIKQNTKLVTMDKKVLKAFPSVAMSLSDAVANLP